MSNIVNKIEHVWSIACSLSATDQDTKNISLFNLIETINISSPEKVRSGDTFKIPMQFELITRLRKKDPKQKDIPFILKISTCDKNGETIGEATETPLTFPEKWSNTRFRNRIPGIEIKDQGLHYLRVDIKEPEDKEFISIARIPIDIRFQS